MQHSFKYILIGLVAVTAACKPFFSFSTYRISSYQYLERADDLTREGEYAQAIIMYQKHIQYRLSVEDRPAWENPHFYELIIGDLELKQGKVSEALAAYERAEREKVDPAFVSDRFLYVARWYEKQGKLKEALNVLEQYRDRDTLLFDLVSDRIARTLVRMDNEPSVPTPAPDAINASTNTTELPPQITTPTPTATPHRVFPKFSDFP